MRRDLKPGGAVGQTVGAFPKVLQRMSQRRHSEIEGGCFLPLRLQLHSGPPTGVLSYFFLKGEGE